MLSHRRLKFLSNYSSYSGVYTGGLTLIQSVERRNAANKKTCEAFKCIMQLINKSTRYQTGMVIFAQQSILYCMLSEAKFLKNFSFLTSVTSVNVEKVYG